MTLCILNWNGKFRYSCQDLCLYVRIITSNPARNNALSASVQVEKSNLSNRAAERSSCISLKEPEVLGYYKYFTVPALLCTDDEGNTFLRNDGIHLPVDICIFTSNLIHPNRSPQRGQHAYAVKIGVYINKLLE
jgi:hypothetical protein